MYYPAKDSTWTSSVRKDYGGNMTWRCVVPTTPGSVKATNTASTGKIKLIWKTSPEATKYRIYRATSKTGTYKLIKTLSKSYLSYTDSDAKIGTTYYYKITAVDENGKASSYSSVVSQTPDLKRPTIKVTNVASTGKLKVTWSKITGAKQYKIYRATSKSGTYKLLKTQTGVTYTDTSASAGKTYYYKVVAVHSNTKANSAYSEIVSGVCDLKQPTIKVSVVTSSGKLKVTWNKITGAKQYKIYRATSKTGTYKLVKTQTGTSSARQPAQSQQPSRSYRCSCPAFRRAIFQTLSAPPPACPASGCSCPASAYPS